MTSPQDTVLEHLRAVLAKSPHVRLAVLFGSQAAGTARAASDFDVGVLPRGDNLSLHAELELASELSGAVGGEVDLVRLDGDEPLLGWEVARNGVCLFESQPGDFVSYRARAISTWLDFDETIAPHRARFLADSRVNDARHPPHEKLAILQEHLRRLRERRPAELATFQADALLQDAIALSALMVVREAIDIALHIASDEGWEHAASYRDAFITLGRHAVVDASLATQLASASQFRNRIAHGYSSFDVDRWWSELPDGIAVFSAFAGQVATFIARQPGA